MKLGADIHFAAVAFFIISLLIQRFTKERTYNADYPGPYDYWHFRFGFREITSFSILLCAYNFSFIEFPLYHSLGKDRTPKKLLDATALALCFTLIIYVSTGLLVIYLFGSGVDPNCLVNIADEGGNVLSYLNRVFFAIVIACHVPFVFFYGKEGICIVIDEIQHKSTSAQLSAKKRAVVHEDKDEPPAYLNMNPKIYYGVTVFLYVLVITCANLVPDVAVIFDYMAALSISGMQFLLPGISYIRMCKRTGTKTQWVYVLAWFYCCFSIVVSVSIIVNNLMKEV